jgi:hypothetical protein
MCNPQRGLLQGTREVYLGGYKKNDEEKYQI